MVEYDAVVVGAGHNGLVAGAYLAKAGLKTLILERRSIVGGACITEELADCKISSLAYTVGLLNSKVIEELKLKEEGYRAYPYDPQFFMPFPDGKHIFLWLDEDKTVNEISRFSKKDAKAYRDFNKLLDDFYSVVESIIDGPPPPMSELAKLADIPEMAEIVKLFLFSSAKSLLDEFFESEEVKAILATQALIGSFSGPMSIGSAYVMIHHFLTEVNGIRGAWGYVKGGMGTVTQIIAKAAKRFGAEILTNQEVEKIIVEDGKAKGIVLRDGKEIRSKIVMSAIDPKTTLLKLVGKDYLDEDFVRRIERIKAEGCVSKINCVLSELPDFKAYPGKSLGPQHKGTIDIGPSIDYMEKAYDDAKYGDISKEPFLEMVIQSAVDDTVAPQGRHTLSIFFQYSPYDLRKGSWEERREEVAERAFNKLEQYAPNIRKALVAYRVITPFDMEREYGLPRGDIFHVAMTPDQLTALRPMPGISDYTTPIENLYLCSAGTHPGGGVMGLCGRNAANKAINKLREG